MSPLTSVINAIHHEQLSARQRETLTGLLLNLAAIYDGMTWCPQMQQVQTAYRELLAAGDAAPGGARYAQVCGLLQWYQR